MIQFHHRILQRITALVVLTTALLCNDTVAPIDPQGQDPKGRWQLVYELPMDELQHSLRVNADESLEQSLERSVAIVAYRVASQGVVSRHGTTGFTIDIEDASGESVSKIRTIVEVLGRLEMRMVAYGDYSKDGVQFELDRETDQMHEWLDAGGRERLLADRSAIDDYRPISKHLKWIVHRIGPDANRPGKWQDRKSDHLPESVFVSPNADWSLGVIPAHMEARPLDEQFVIEVLPINLHEMHFTSADLERDSLRVVETISGFGVRYRTHGSRLLAYADWTEEHIGECCAFLWEGELLSTPVFLSRIPGIGILNTDGDREQAEITKSMLAGQLPAMPRLIKSEAR